MAPERIHIDENQLVMMFAASCIEWAADAFNCDYRDIFNRMDKVGLIENYIVECYDVLHLETRKNITDDVVRTLLLWEEKQKESEEL